MSQQISQQQTSDPVEAAGPATDLALTPATSDLTPPPGLQAPPPEPEPTRAHWAADLGFDLYARCCIDPEHHTPTLLESHGLTPQTAARMEGMIMDDLLAQDVATTEQATFIETANTPDPTQLEALRKLGVQALCCLPTLNDDGELTGAALFATSQADAFTQSQRRWLRAAAALLAGPTHDGVEADEPGQPASASDAGFPHLTETLQQQVDRRAEELANYHSQLRHLLSELVLTEQRERRRIAGELHDHLAQLLVACKMKLALISKTRQSAELLKEIDGFLNESLAYTRNLVAQISPVLLYEQGLLPALRWLAEAVMPRHGLEVTLQEQTDLADVQLDEDVRILLFQSVRELLFNVVKHAGAHEARVSVQRVDGELIVTIDDEGTGFDVEKVRMTGGTSQQGFGLLSIRERMTLLGGRLELTSAPGAGTRARVRLLLEPGPLPEARPDEPTTTAAPPADTEQRASRDHLHVLVVDDHAVVREGLMMMLGKERGLAIVGEAADGPTAIDLARRLRPHVVLMDVGLPGMDGIETTRRITQTCRGVKVVGLSMHEDESTASAMRAAGAVEYLCKGCSPELLIGTIRRAARQTITP